MMLLSGLLAALLEAARSGKGQVIDAAMTDGVIALLSICFSHPCVAIAASATRPGELMLAGAAPYYGTFETSDGKYLAIGSIEPQFYALLIEKLGVDRKFLAAGFPASRKHWPEAEAAIAAAVRTRTRDEWAAIFEGTDACVAPVLSLGRGRAASAQRRARQLHHGEWRRAARAGTAVQPHRGGTGRRRRIVQALTAARSWRRRDFPRRKSSSCAQPARCPDRDRPSARGRARPS